MYIRIAQSMLLGTVVTVLVAWTEFWYKVGSPSLGTKLVHSYDRSDSNVRKAKVAKVSIIHSGKRSEHFVVFLAKVSNLNLGVSYVVSYDMRMRTHHMVVWYVSYDMIWCIAQYYVSIILVDRAGAHRFVSPR